MDFKQKTPCENCPMLKKNWDTSDKDVKLSLSNACDSQESHSCTDNPESHCAGQLIYFRNKKIESTKMRRGLKANLFELYDFKSEDEIVGDVEVDAMLTQHAMNLSEDSLKEDWDEEDENKSEED